MRLQLDTHFELSLKARAHRSLNFHLEQLVIACPYCNIHSRT